MSFPKTTPKRSPKLRIPILGLLLALYLPLISAVFHTLHTCQRASNHYGTCRKSIPGNLNQGPRTVICPSNPKSQFAAPTCHNPAQPVRPHSRKCRACAFFQHFLGQDSGPPLGLTPQWIVIDQIGPFYSTIIVSPYFVCPIPRAPPRASLA
ncbi:MAG: hypothetical protein PHW74_03045 [Desulfobacca sp.]|nr:hypothetical protein [Desulfobacca sp.]